jgi:hypothetical protein
MDFSARRNEKESGMTGKKGDLQETVLRARSILRKKYQVNDADIILASYPRSGNTWMRVILAELLYGKSGESLANLQSLVPDIHVPIFAADLIRADFHIIKSHRPRRMDLEKLLNNRSIYLVRDPRDVVTSYYKFVGELRNYRGSFEDFCLDWLNGRIWPCSWREHVNSWTGPQTSESQDQVIIRYEDLAASFNEELIRLSRFLNVSLSESKIKEIAHNSSISEMRRKAQQGVGQNNFSRDYQFIGKAQIGSWKDLFSKSLAGIFVDQLGDLMKKFGYSLD